MVSPYAKPCPVCKRVALLYARGLCADCELGRDVRPGL